MIFEHDQNQISVQIITFALEMYGCGNVDQSIGMTGQPADIIEFACLYADHRSIGCKAFRKQCIYLFLIRFKRYSQTLYIRRLVKHTLSFHALHSCRRSEEYRLHIKLIFFKFECHNDLSFHTQSTSALYFLTFLYLHYTPVCIKFKTSRVTF